MDKKIVFWAAIFFAIFIFLYLVGKFTVKPYAVSGSVDAQRVYKLAADRRDITVCDGIWLAGVADVTTGELKSNCYEYYAWTHPEQDICGRIGNDFICVNARAVASKDPNICLSLDDGKSQALCVADVAIAEKDQTICKIIKDTDIVRDCVMHFTNGGFSVSPPQYDVAK